MSAYIVGKAHIEALLRAGMDSRYGLGDLRWLAREWEEGDDYREIARRLDHETVTRVGWMLVDENVASVRHRYPDDAPHELPGPSDRYFLPERRDSERFDLQHARALTPIETLKAISGYEYQSCEHPGWRRSEAWQFCDSLKDRMIGSLPGYEEADTWEVEPEPPFDMAGGGVSLIR